jgi:hypothetical protein
VFLPWKHPESPFIEHVNEKLLSGKSVTAFNKLKRTVASCNGRQ